MAEERTGGEVAAADVRVESPPAAPQPERVDGDEARVRLHQLADRLVRGRERQALAEYLRLRRSLM